MHICGGNLDITHNSIQIQVVTAFSQVFATETLSYSANYYIESNYFYIYMSWFGYRFGTV